MLKRFARWVLRNEALLPEVGDRFWTGHVHLVVMAQTYSQGPDGHTVTLTLVRPVDVPAPGIPAYFKAG